MTKSPSSSAPQCSGSLGLQRERGGSARQKDQGREAFLSGDRGTARVYLQNLVDHIVIGEDEIVIEAKAGAALAMLAASRPAVAESTSGEVLADVVDWRTP
jgi:hypothetical protein